LFCVACDFRIAIVGSGPAGLSAAAHAAELGLGHVLLEKTDHLSDTIYKYQKGKHVMATPSQLVLRADLDFEAGKREKILDTWNAQTGEHKVNVKFNAEIVSISGEMGNFTLKTKAGDTITAETVILGIGTQGNPNLVRCPVGEGAVVQYQLDDPGEYIDEHIFVIGTGDAGIENALGLAADPEQRNTVTIVNRGTEFATAKDANVKLLMQAEADGRVRVLRESTVNKIDKGWATFDTRDGEQRFRCDRLIARIGSAPPRAFVEGCCAQFEEKPDPRNPERKVKGVVAGTGITFSSPDRLSYPSLSPSFETSVPGIYVIGALAGYPLIKHCMNQGYDVIEFINGNTDLKPADEPILEKKFSVLPGQRSVTEWLAFLRRRVSIFNEMSMLQMREFMLDSEPVSYRAGDVIFERNEPGSSLFAIADGDGRGRGRSDQPERHRADPAGLDRRRGRPHLRPQARRHRARRLGRDRHRDPAQRGAEIDVGGAGREARDHPHLDRAPIAADVRLRRHFGRPQGGARHRRDPERARRRGDHHRGRRELRHLRHPPGLDGRREEIGGKPVFLSYLPAGSYVGEMALIDGGRRTATVRAAIKSEVIKLGGDAFRRLLEAKPDLMKRFERDMAARYELTSFIEDRKDGFGGVIDLYSNVASFLVANGIGEATDCC
jgi:cGMP-dependent protein kinase 2